MPKPFIFTQVAERGRAEGFGSPMDSYRARQWFRKTARHVQSVNVNRLLEGTPSRHHTKLTPEDIGQLFVYWYDAKLKDKLPYWDQFPLMIPFRVEADHFLGYNLHYISPYRRALVFNSLYKIAYRDDKNRIWKLNATYDMLGSISRLDWLRPCIKMYLNSHVRSRFMWLRPEEWDTAISLPMARFVGASPLKVHRDSAQRVRVHRGGREGRMY